MGLLEERPSRECVISMMSVFSTVYCTFSNIPAAAGIAKISQYLSSPMSDQGRRYETPLLRHSHLPNLTRTMRFGRFIF